MTDVTLTLVPWSPGDLIGAYPRRSEQILPDMPPTMIPAKETRPVADDATLTFTTLPDGEYWAIEKPESGAPTAFTSGPPTQYVSFNVETEKTSAAGAIEQGQMRSFLDANGDFWLADNAVLEGGVWNRVDTSKYAYAMQWIVNGIIPGEELIDPIGGIVFWRCIPGANPIGPVTTFGGWENIYLVTQYRDFVIGGQAIEMDGAGTFPFGRFIHAPEGTFIGTNAYADFNGRDDPAADSLVLGVFGDEFKVRRWPANQPKSAIVDLLTLDAAGNLSVAGSSPGSAVLSALDVAQHTTGSTAFQYMGTAQIVIPTSGDYELAMTCRLALNGITNQAIAGIGVNGVVDESTELWRSGPATAAFESTTHSVAGRVMALNAGDVLRPMLRQTSASTAYIDHMTMTARPA